MPAKKNTASGRTATQYADVILPLAVPKKYTYLVPEALRGKVKAGMRVEVQFGRKKHYAAIVCGLHHQKPKNYTVKPLADVVDARPLLHERQLRFWDWLSEYYMCHPGEVMHAALPSGLRLSSESRITLRLDDKAYRTVHPRLSNASDPAHRKAALLLEALREQGELTVDEVRHFVQQKTVYPLIKWLLDQAYVAMYERMGGGYKPQTVTCVRLAEPYRKDKPLQQLFAALEKAPRQLDLLMKYRQLSQKSSHVHKKHLLEATGASASPLEALVKKGVFETYDHRITRLTDKKLTKPAKFQLTESQQEGLAQIRKQWEEKSTVLLHGVTASGKTHLYVRLIEAQLEACKQVLYLLPEIALTTQLINRLREYFGEAVGVYHSRFNTHERVEIWQKVRDGKYRIVLGARSALFLPWDTLGLVIVDEEHDSSFKQYNPAPRYHARDSAVYLARLHGAKALLGTATPSLESFFNARAGKYGLVQLTERYGGFKMPELIVADLRREKRKQSHFTGTLVHAIKDALEAGKQAILFQNRRGYAPYLECSQCGWTPYCRNCDVSMTQHKYRNELRCHYCGYRAGHPDACPACGSTHIRVHGFGTQKVEEELETLFPKHRTRRMDLDTTRGKHGFSRLIGDFEAGRIDILVGTQMVTKGLDFDNVEVVGILSAENLLNFPDFRAHERAFQLMAQVSGRAGRKKQRGKVIIQTYKPDHPVTQLVLQNAYEEFYRLEVSERKQHKYPPLCRLIRLTLRHGQKGKVEAAARDLAGQLLHKPGLEVLGPVDGPIPRVQNKYIKHILLKLYWKNQPLPDLKAVVLKTLQHFSANRKWRVVQLQVDVDPV